MFRWLNSTILRNDQYSDVFLCFVRKRRHRIGNLLNQDPLKDSCFSLQLKLWLLQPFCFFGGVLCGCEWVWAVLLPDGVVRRCKTSTKDHPFVLFYDTYSKWQINFAYIVLFHCAQSIHWEPFGAQCFARGHFCTWAMGGMGNWTCSLRI